VRVTRHLAVSGILEVQLRSFVERIKKKRAQVYVIYIFVQLRAYMSEKYLYLLFVTRVAVAQPWVLKGRATVIMCTLYKGWGGKCISKKREGPRNVNKDTRRAAVAAGRTGKLSER